MPPSLARVAFTQGTPPPGYGLARATMKEIVDAWSAPACPVIDVRLVKGTFRVSDQPVDRECARPREHGRLGMNWSEDRPLRP
ncbi:hypothetical protein GCM10010246_02790 [Streptomyces cuspidosporus]|uniref:Uncharacterized protein n=1 Tax=Streptomyces cuspidosporus TaxID=66882 RepID=A0ABP5S6I4_9ACTN